MVQETSPVLTAKKLVLVDAYSLLFRAFFAGRYLSTNDNRPTGALYGFTNMLFSLLNTEKPDAITVCWDGPERTLRSQQFEAYKAHRPEVDPQLKAQMPDARRIVEAFGIASAEVPGYEADDLIGTLATQGAREGYAVTILTGDSDQLQLVGDGITVQMTQRGVSEVKLYDADAVRERYGIGPERIADWKALVGDTSDNIPGVPGIGDKTATALLQHWDTLENLLDHIPEVLPNKARLALEANVEQARLSKELATIVCDVPAELIIRPYSPSEEDWQRVRDIFIEFEFKSLLARIPRPANSSGVAPVIEEEALAPTEIFTTQSVLIRSDAELAAALEAVQQSRVVAILPETSGGLPMQTTLRGLAFAPSTEMGYYVPVRLPVDAESKIGGLFDAEEESTEYAAPLAALRPLFTDTGLVRYGHNAKLPLLLLERYGEKAAPFAFDTLIAAYLLESGRAAYPLMDLAETYLRKRLETGDAFSPPETLARETALIVALVPALQAELEKLEMTEILERVEMPLVPVLAEVEQVGLLIDKPYLGTLSIRLNGEMEGLAKEVYALAGEEFNIGSTKQLQTILFEKMQLPTGKKTKTGFSTGADLLEQLAAEFPIARKILDYREIAKLKATYADALTKLVDPKSNRVHTSLNQAVASTGRLSSSDPNLQNIPVRSEAGREIRRTFIAPKGRVLLSCDYSQIELRILAHVTGDPALTQAFQSNADVHAATAARVFSVPLEEVTSDQRRQAKTINFAVIYGQSGFALASTLGVDTKVANTWIKEYFEQLPGVQKYVEETMALAHKQKYVTTLMGRRRYLPELDSGNHSMRQFAERAAVNMPIQGTAADIMKLAMIAVYHHVRQTWGRHGALLLQVHDELLFEVDTDLVPEFTPDIQRIMETAYPLRVPLRVDAKAGPNWAEMKGPG